MSQHQGACQCGAVAFEISGEMGRVVACHCSQCRKTSGHFWASLQVANEDLHLTRKDGLAWYRSSDTARRGFCRFCGASLFWELDGEGKTSVGAGMLNAPTGTKLTGHIFVADKGDYYKLTDDLPKADRW